jgi:hypothetical protein
MNNYLSKINEKYLIAPKAIYFIVNMQFYGFHQLKSAFAKDKFNISTEDYGKYTGYTQFITFFTSILIGNITDRTKKYQTSLLALIALSTMVFLMFYIDSIAGLNSSMFWVFLLFYLVLNNPKQPLLDKIMIEHLDKTSESGSRIYGKQRLWGSFALPLATFVSEWCTNIGDGEYNYDNLIHYNVIATIFAIAVVMIFFYPRRRSGFEEAQETLKAEKTKENATSRVTNIPVGQADQNVRTSGNVFELVKNFEFMFFFVIIFLNAISRSALTIYLQLFHKEILMITPKEVPEDWNSVSKFFFSSFFDKPISILATAGVVFEIIILFVADKVINKCGYFLPLVIAQIISLARFLAYYLIDSENPYAYQISCGVELLRGMYFGLIHISSVYIATKMAPSYLRTTSQMIYQGTFGALGFLVSGQIFGNLFKSKLAKELDFISKEQAYKQIFLINILIAVFTIGLCIVKYGLIDKVLFNKENERKKLSKFDEIPQSNQSIPVQ